MADVLIDPAQVALALRPDMDALIEERTNTKINAALKLLEDRYTAHGVVTPDGGTADPDIQNFGDYLLAVKRGDVKRLEKVYKAVKLNEQDGSEGGYLVPEQFDSRLLQVASQVNPIDALTGNRAPMTIPMAGRIVNLPALDQTVTPTTGTSAFDAGVVATWTGEGIAKTQTEPAFRNVTLTAHKLAGYTVVSDELEADSAVALDALLTRLFGQAIGRQRLYSFLKGNGSGKPLGIQNAPAAIGVTRTGGGNAFDAADVPLMVRRLYPGSLANAVWFMHPFTLSDLSTMTFGTNNVLSWANIVDGAPGTLFGLPFYPVEFMSAPGTAFDVALIDWSYYLVGQRGQTAIAVSEHVYFINDQKAWRFVHRVDGQPWPSGPTILSDGAGTNTVSPFVYLS